MAKFVEVMIFIMGFTSGLFCVPLVNYFVSLIIEQQDNEQKNR